MRILEISPNGFVGGGSDRYFVELSAILETAGHEVYRFCRHHPLNPSSEYDDFFPVGIDTAKPSYSDVARMFYSLDAAQKLREFLNKHLVDVAHLHIYYGHFSASILRVLVDFNIPIVQTVHDYKLICPISTCNRHGLICSKCKSGGYWRAALYRCNRGSVMRSVVSSTESYLTKAVGSHRLIDTYIPVCQFQADILTSSGISASKIRVLHNFIDINRFQVNSEGSEKNVILYIGRIEESKGIFQLLQCFRSIPPAERKGVKLIFAGTGEARDKLVLELERCGDECIEYVGFLNHKEARQYLERAICTVLVPNVYENCSMAVLESLACGVPVIGGEVGGLPEIISHGNDGLLVQTGNLEQFRAAILMLINDRADARRMGINGARKISEQFNADVHLAKILKIFREAIDQKVKRIQSEPVCDS